MGAYIVVGRGGRQNKQEVVGDLENNKLGKRYVV